MAKKMKKPWVAATLNAILPGLGYLYVGKRKNFGVMLIVAAILIMIIPSTGEWSSQDTLSLPSAIVVMLAFAYDGYRTAEEANRRK